MNIGIIESNLIEHGLHNQVWASYYKYCHQDDLKKTATQCIGV